jgi:inositol transport system substrate-binding protein
LKKSYVCAAAVAALALSTVSAKAAETVGVSMGLLGNNLFQTLIRDSMNKHARTLDGVTLQVEDAGGDINRQLDQIRNFIASGVSAIVIDPADSSATAAMSKLASNADIPLVYVNIQPDNIDKLPPKQAFVGSDERESGTMQAKEVCRLLGGQGNVAIMIGDLTTQTAQQRTQDVYDIMATEPCKGIKIAGAQVANWSRVDGSNLVMNWMSSGLELNGILANNDEMALGAAMAVKAAGRAASKVVIGGIDATQDGLRAIETGDIDVTVFQDAAGQGRGALETALKLARGETVPKKTYIPFQLVTRENVKDFQNSN